MGRPDAGRAGAPKAGAALTVPASLDRGTATPDERRALFEALLLILWAMGKVGMVGASVRLTDSPPPPFGIGTRGPIVKIWQMIVGAAPDEVFGQKTEALTVKWATAAGFGPRKTVEPAMWSVAVGLTFRIDAAGVTQPGGEILLCPGSVEPDVRQILGNGAPS